MSLLKDFTMESGAFTLTRERDVLKVYQAGKLVCAVQDNAADPAPIDMLLWCPKCHAQHIDAPGADFDGHDHRWDNPPHKSHLCHTCGTIWRPADVPTNGVASIETRGKADNWPVL